MRTTQARLTPAQLQVLAYIDRYAYLESFPPTRREIGAHMGWSSPSTAQNVIEALERKNVIERTRNGLVRLTTLGHSVLNSQELIR